MTLLIALTILNFVIFMNVLVILYLGRKRKKIYTHTAKQITDGILYHNYNCRYVVQVQAGEQEMKEMEYRFSFNYN